MPLLRVNARLSPVSAADPLKRIAIALRAGRQRFNYVIAQEFANIARSNFGPAGRYRATDWPPYKRNYPKYGKRRGDPATLMRSGTLLASISVSATATSATVSAQGSRNYAAAQQFGTRNLPPRPYFPVFKSGGSLQLTTYALARMQNAFEAEVRKILSIR